MKKLILILILSAIFYHQSAIVIQPVSAQITNPCNPITFSCFAQWVQEFAGIQTSKLADLNNDTIINLIDFEKYARPTMPFPPSPGPTGNLSGEDTSRNER